MPHSQALFITLGLLLVCACDDGKQAGDSGEPPITDADADGYDAIAHGGDDCDDSDGAVHPAADELCNGYDDDCDGETDEDDALDASTWYADADGDGFGDADNSVLSCDAPPLHVATGDDCDDSSSLVYPGAEEIADDGIDQDCDGADAEAPPTIAEIRQDASSWIGLEVSLEGVVATSGMDSNGDGFFVQDAGGGDYSGIYVYDATASLSVTTGQVLDITGIIADYYDLLEIQVADAADVVDTGSTDTPVASVLSSAPADWEVYEGALLQLSDVLVTTDEDSYGEVELDIGISMDDLLYDFTGVAGDAYDDLTGPLHYSWGEFKICPRDAGDMTEASYVTIADIRQDQSAYEGTTVTLENVVATSEVNSGGYGFFIQDIGGGEHSGLFVYDSSSAVSVTTGQVLDVTGLIYDYYDLLEIQVADAADVTDTGVTLEPVASQLSSAPSDWEVYEGALLELSGVTLTSDVDSYGEATLDIGVSMDDLFYGFSGSAGDYYSTVYGPLYYSYKVFKICPRDASDLVP